MENFNENPQPIGRLGSLPAKSSMKALQFADFQTTDAFSRIPAFSKFWTKRAPFPLRTFGNNQYGNCTRAKQANAAMRMERLETRATPEITDEEVIRVYVDMSNRLYGGGDNGAYETDALGEWRKPDLTFRDTKGRPLTIDAFLRVNHTDISEIKKALYLSASHGLAICLNLPIVYSKILPPNVWDVPDDWMTKREYFPGSWGGHSLWATEYAKEGLVLTHTWGIPNQLITWKALAIYGMESHIVIDSLNSWRVSKPKVLNYDAIKDAVNSVSSQKIK